MCVTVHKNWFDTCGITVHQRVYCTVCTRAVHPRSTHTQYAPPQTYPVSADSAQSTQRGGGGGGPGYTDNCVTTTYEESASIADPNTPTQEGLNGVLKTHIQNQ